MYDIVCVTIDLQSYFIIKKCLKVYLLLVQYMH